jgi:hypothetical protein
LLLINSSSCVSLLLPLLLLSCLCLHALYRLYCLTVGQLLLLLDQQLCSLW